MKRVGTLEIRFTRKAMSKPGRKKIRPTAIHDETHPGYKYCFHPCRGRPQGPHERVEATSRIRCRVEVDETELLTIFFQAAGRLYCCAVASKYAGVYSPRRTSTCSCQLLWKVRRRDNPNIGSRKVYQRAEKFVSLSMLT